MVHSLIGLGSPRPLTHQGHTGFCDAIYHNYHHLASPLCKISNNYFLWHFLDNAQK